MIVKKYITLIACFVLILATSCDNFLEEESKSELSTATFFNTDAEAKLAINGLYSLLHGNNLYRNAALDYFYQFGSDEVGVNRAENVEQSDYTWNQSSTWIYDTYKSLYEVVRNASLFIGSIEESEKISQAVKDQSVGEALFVRALAYWHLTNLWGDVPYFRELLSITELSTLPKTDDNVIRAEMITDLERAFSLLPGTYSEAELGRVTKWAAIALKAKFYMKRDVNEMTSADWQGMRDESVRLINNPDGFRLLDSFADVFNQGDWSSQFNDEVIFAVDFYGVDAVSSDFKYQRMNWFVGRVKKDEPLRKNEPGVLAAFEAALKDKNENMRGYGKMIPMPEIGRQENWEDGDMRFDVTIMNEYLGFELKFPYYRKMVNFDNEYSPRSNSGNNFVVFRMADFYLMAAEAENELSGPDNAYQYVNAVRARAFEPDQPWSGISQEEFRLKIRDERKYELCAEGYRKYDLIRWGILLETVKSMEVRSHNNPSASIQEKHTVYPIPEEEIILNPNVEQDPLWR